MKGTSSARLALTGLAVSAGVVAPMAVASPASAAPYDDCLAGRLCAYVGAHGTGDQGSVQYNNTDLLQYPPFDNANSVINHGTQCSVVIYNGLGYTGTNVRLPIGTGYGVLRDNYPAFYKNIASNRWC